MQRTRDRSDIVRDLERDLGEEEQILHALERDLSTEGTILHRMEVEFAELRETLAAEAAEPPARPSGALQAFVTVLVVGFIALAGFAFGRSVENVTTDDLTAQLAVSEAQVASMAPLVNAAYEASDLGTQFREAAGWRYLDSEVRSGFDASDGLEPWERALLAADPNGSAPGR